ncbi:MAG TPA: LPS export ABC transporter periplasmic protein LptC [Bacteroidales bacterium]|nr:LPS export ABC transporter periplasmic protein LptC [Bacteroidales bacterium]HNV96247.1 LPS export ABC transporter periplasmic protein LptC [Bacteroidales bacterium]HOU97983.1 LPS export ABC transporter periplasmic protein LptC [Bacteroidales bacterium]
MKVIFYIPAFVLIAFFYSCSNSIETVNSIVSSDTIPVLSSKNFYLTRSDSGKIIVRAKAKLVQYIITNKDSFTIFPEGIVVETFTNYPEVESMISAKYAKHYESKKRWEVKNNVVARNYKGDTLYTELLYWNEATKKVYSNKFCKIITQDGLLIGKNGFEADESMTKWKVLNTEGTVNVKDE